MKAFKTNPLYFFKKKKKKKTMSKKRGGTRGEKNIWGNEKPSAAKKRKRKTRENTPSIKQKRVNRIRERVQDEVPVFCIDRFKDVAVEVELEKGGVSRLRISFTQPGTLTQANEYLVDIQSVDRFEGSEKVRKELYHRLALILDKKEKES